MENGKFVDDGSAVLTFFGTKNDTHRTGFECHLPPHSDPLLDPVRALRVYINRTNRERAHAHHSPVFLTLRQPYRHLDAASIAKVMNEAIIMAGLDGRQFTAKSFRPTGATSAVDAAVEPDKVRRLGRWKTQEVFYYHYVRNKMNNDFTDNLLKAPSGMRP